MAKPEDDSKDSITTIINAATGIRSRNALLTAALGIGGYAAKFVQQTADDIRQIRVEVSSFVETIKQVKETQKDQEDRLRFLELKDASRVKRR